MFKYIKEYRFYIVLFLFVLIPIMSIDTATRAPHQYRIYDNVILGLTRPVQAAIGWTLDTIVSSFHNYIYLWKTRQQNTELLKENRRLLNSIVDLREVQQENVRLRRLLGFKESFKFKAVVARVIAKDASTEFRTIRINRGSDDGIQKDMAVLNDQGIVGRVYRTTGSTSDVVTILNSLSAVDSIVRRSRVPGIVQGRTDEKLRCELKFALRTDDIDREDVLVSSGLGGIFPKGVPVGQVTKVLKKPYGITQIVEVRPSVDFSQLEEVLVITKKSTAPIHLAQSRKTKIPPELVERKKVKKVEPAPAPAPPAQEGGEEGQ